MALVLTAGSWAVGEGEGGREGRREERGRGGERRERERGREGERRGDMDVCASPQKGAWPTKPGSLMRSTHYPMLAEDQAADPITMATTTGNQPQQLAMET